MRGQESTSLGVHLKRDSSVASKQATTPDIASAVRTWLGAEVACAARLAGQIHLALFFLSSGITQRGRQP